MAHKPKETSSVYVNAENANSVLDSWLQQELDDEIGSDNEEQE